MTTRSSPFLRCASPYEKSLRKNFCFGFFPNHFAVPRNVRPRSLTTRSSLFLRCASPYEKSLRKNPSESVRLASLQLGKVRPRSSLRVPRFSSSCLVLREKSFAKTFALAFALAKNKMVGLGRLELLTSRLSGVRSNQLSYRPM